MWGSLGTQVVTTGYCRLSGFCHKNVCLQFWRLGSVRSRCQLIQFLVRPFLARQLCSLAPSWWREEANTVASSKGADPIMGPHPHHLLTSQRSHLPPQDWEETHTSSSQQLGWGRRIALGPGQGVREHWEVREG